MDSPIEEQHPENKTMKIGKLLPVIAVFVVAAGVIFWTTTVSQEKTSTSTRAAVAVSPPESRPNGKTKITMTALMGTIVLREIEGKMWVNVNIPSSEDRGKEEEEEEEKEEEHPLTIHEGTCANPGAVKYTLNHTDDGGSETFLSVNVAEFRKQLPLSLVAHASETDATTVSCGDISIIY